MPTVYNHEGLPFSKWTPSDKFAYTWEQHAPEGGEPELEYTFVEDRNWRFDYAWPQFKVAVEIQGFGRGGVGGGHQLQARMMNDNEKHNQALELGWAVLRYDSRWLGSYERCVAAALQTLDIIIQRSQQNQ